MAITLQTFTKRISESSNWKVIKRQWQVVQIPMLLAVVYACVSLYLAAPADRSAFQFMKDCVVALFFIMWFVGQFLRTSKELHDKDHFTTILTGIDDLKESIDELGSAAPSTPQTTGNTIMDSAERAVKAGHVLAGLLQAGVALEQTLVAKARAVQLQLDGPTSGARIIRGLGDHYDKGTILELQALWRLRNRLVHLDAEATDELTTRPDLIDYFKWAVSTLEKDQSRNTQQSQ